MFLCRPKNEEVEYFRLPPMCDDSICLNVPRWVLCLIAEQRLTLSLKSVKKTSQQTTQYYSWIFDTSHVAVDSYLMRTVNDVEWLSSVAFHKLYEEVIVPKIEVHS